MQETTWNDVWRVRSQVYSFLGNSLLRVMSDETSAGLDPEFWRGFPLEAANEHMEHALAKLLRAAESLAALPHEDAVQAVAAEYTKLFIGPGTPPAPLWESLYREGGKYLFGQPTFDMKQILREHGLALEESAHQLEDHLAVELLYLAVMSYGFAEAAPSTEETRGQAEFIKAHPLWWVGDLHERALNASTSGYYAPLIELVWGVLEWDVDLLAEY